jgi:hypothetical protein
VITLEKDNLPEELFKVFVLHLESELELWKKQVEAALKIPSIKCNKKDGFRQTF